MHMERRGKDVEQSSARYRGGELTYKRGPEGGFQGKHAPCSKVQVQKLKAAIFNFYL